MGQACVCAGEVGTPLLGSTTQLPHAFLKRLLIWLTGPEGQLYAGASAA